MKYSILTLLIILSLFLITQFVGLSANRIYINKELPYGLKPPKIEAKISPWFFISAIVIMSLLFLTMKVKFKLLLKLWFFIAFTICCAITLSAFIEGWISIFIALTISILKFKERDIYVHNLGEILVYGGVVAIFSPIFKFWSSILLLIIISIYDYIAVFITKHMIGLAKMQEELGIFSGLIVVNKGEVAILGGGDIAFSLLFSVTVLREFGMLSALLSIYGATLLLSILMLVGKKKKYYPAMPFITVGLIFGFLISLI